MLYAMEISEIVVAFQLAGCICGFQLAGCTLDIKQILYLSDGATNDAREEKLSCLPLKLVRFRHSLGHRAEVHPPCNVPTCGPSQRGYPTSRTSTLRFSFPNLNGAHNNVASTRNLGGSPLNPLANIGKHKSNCVGLLTIHKSLHFSHQSSDCPLHVP